MKNKFTIISLIFIAFTLSMGIPSCKEENPEKPTNDEELITTLRMIFYHATDSTRAGEFLFTDTDGAGGLEPQRWDTIRLSPNQSYLAVIELLNESNPSSIVYVSAEVREEADEHLFCFQTGLDGLSVQYADTDGTHPIGLNTLWNTGKSGTGSVVVSLKHQPDGLKNGACEPGDTDIEVAFPIVVE